MKELLDRAYAVAEATLLIALALLALTAASAIAGVVFSRPLTEISKYIAAEPLKHADVVLAICALLGPVLAVQAQKFVEAATRRTRDKEWIFGTLMASRGNRIAPDHVRALNMIDLAFNGRYLGLGMRWQLPSEKHVIENWHLYLANLNIVEITDANRDDTFRQRTILFGALLSAMSNSLDYKLTFSEIMENGYSPQASVNAGEEQRHLLMSTLDLLDGKRPLRVAVHAEQ